MSNFQAWLAEADLPGKEFGKWVDLETGLPYDPDFDYAVGARRVRQHVSPSAQDARAVAKTFGGRALTGSSNQKEWAEKIRAAALRQMTADEAELVCACRSVTGSAKFWIETRTATGKDIAAFVQRLVVAVKSANTRNRAGERVPASEIAQIQKAQAGDMSAL